LRLQTDFGGLNWCWSCYSCRSTREWHNRRCQ